MNKKIIEIAQEANAYAIGFGAKTGDEFEDVYEKKFTELMREAFDTAEYPESQVYRIEPNDAFCKKFTELILTECVKKISEEQDLVENNWQCKNGVHITWELKKMFGLK